MNYDKMEVYEVQVEFSSRDRQAYVVGRTEEDVREFLSNMKVDYMFKVGTVDSYLSDDEIVSTLGLKNIGFLT